MATALSMEIGGRTLRVTNPDKVVFPSFEGRPAVTKLALIEYYLAVADGALRGVAGRPMILKRFVKGITEEAVFQKRAPEKRPEWIDVAELKYASGTSAKEAVLDDAAGLAWAVNLGCVDLNPHPVRAHDLEHPDELRVDLDPMPGVEWAQIVDVALVARDVLTDYGLTAWPKTSGSKGFHVYARIEPNWPYRQVRLAAETIAREVERRAPDFGDQPVVEGRTPRRLRRLQPERQGPDGRVGLLGALPARRPGVDARCAGTRCRTAGPRRSPWRPCRSGTPTSAIHGRAWTTPRAASRDCWPWPRNWAPPRRRPRARAVGDGAGHRVSTMPLIEIARTKTKDEAMAALETWKATHSSAAERLEPIDVLVDGMRGPSSIWYRVRINLQHVPEDERPPQEDLLADYSPWEGYTGNQWRRG